MFTNYLKKNVADFTNALIMHGFSDFYYRNGENNPPFPGAIDRHLYTIPYAPQIGLELTFLKSAMK